MTAHTAHGHGPAKIIRSRPTTAARPNVLGGAAAFVWLLIVSVPLYWILITSLRTQQGFFGESPLAFPTDPTLDNYRTVLANDFGRYLSNSFIVTISAVVLVVASGYLCAYTVARSPNKKTRTMFNVMLLGLAIPLQATIIPIYLMIVKAGLYDNLLAIILPSVAFALPITVLILVNFLRDIPVQLYEAMRIDGASEWEVMVKLAIPLSRPAIVTVAIYSGLNIWNGFLFPLVLTQSPETRVLPLALTSYQGMFTINVPAIIAAVVLSSLPVIALYILGRRQLLAGMTAGFGK
ncbi:carbohydrate ABC transporter permease [Sanguibacter antarcticus]|uniref:Carbohydrate ABC transporter membrane protein 2 (CUT1 family) n=1 Tax=Sanguibacter antarcticus TaxID=372484 RepID=A0A2A9E2E2_9MICO|nr:carbohydrate ABC transporter permease [Sanguibacter antarcticus]PFG33014.1 carbohydrate ABC transporter membrane protein 2 (CUT1 family) [Sanguibacter antarcticus]